SHLQNSTNSSNQYMLLYQNFSKCDSYLHLLDNLKKTYEKFRSTIKNGDPNLESSLQTLTTIENTDSYFVEGFSTFDFSNSKCQSEYDDSILEKSKKTEARTKQKDNGADTLESKDKVVDGSQSKENAKGSEHTDPGSDIGNKANLQSNPSSHTPISDNNQGPQKPVENPVVKSKNFVIKVKGNETTGICDIYVPKEYKQVGILIIVILIPITLAIMYKYLASGRKKELKRKKNMKKVINLMEGKRQMQIIIKS
ncbi:hypothetical protein PCHCB_000512300, partial [Plasmodium chabaudi chabaudi]